MVRAEQAKIQKCINSLSFAIESFRIEIAAANVRHEMLQADDPERKVLKMYVKELEDSIIDLKDIRADYEGRIKANA